MNSSSPWDFSEQRSAENNLSSSERRLGAHRLSERKSELLKRVSASPGSTPDMSGSLGPLTASSRTFKNMVPSNPGALSNTPRPSSDSQPLDLDELIQLVGASYSQFSLQSAAERKQKQLEKILNTISPNDIFWDGGILTKESAEVRCYIFVFRHLFVFFLTHLFRLYISIFLFSKNRLFAV